MNAKDRDLNDIRDLATEVGFSALSISSMELADWAVELIDILLEGEKERAKPQPDPIYDGWDCEKIEAMAHAFRMGAYRGVRGGFPSVAFHDGYREYDDRIPSWNSTRPTERERKQWEMEYAAGAFALHLDSMDIP